MDLFNMIKKLAEDNDCEISLSFSSCTCSNYHLKLKVRDGTRQMNRFLLYDVLESYPESLYNILNFSLREMIGELRKEE